MNAELALVREAIVTGKVPEEARELCEKHYNGEELSEAEMDREIAEKTRIVRKYEQLIDLRVKVKALGLRAALAVKQEAMDTIIEVVATGFDLSREILMSANREERVAYPRQIIFYIARELTPMSLAEIGRALGGKDHGTVLYGIRSVRDRMETVPDYKCRINGLKKVCVELVAKNADEERANTEEGKTND